MTRRTAAVVIAVASVLVAARVWVLSPVTVASDSMEPTVSTGDTVLVDHLSPRLTGWRRGDVVAFSDPQNRELTLKRIIGLPGDQVAIEDAVLLVNGQRVSEPYADNSHEDGVYLGPVTVPGDGYYVLGDHRDGSIDSRVFGAVKRRDLVGRMVLRWSL
jgi:signal peptidase I